MDDTLNKLYAEINTIDDEIIKLHIKKYILFFFTIKVQNLFCQNLTQEVTVWKKAQKILSVSTAEKSATGSIADRRAPYPTAGSFPAI